MTGSKATEMMNAVNKSLKTEALFRGSDERLVVTQTPTGVLPIDILSGGGFPRGRFIEIYGPHSTLKSWIGLQSVVQVQQAGGVAAWIDTEHAYDPEWAALCGVKTDDLLMVPGETAEEKFDTAEAMIRNGLDILVVDSIAALLPQQEHGKRLYKEGVQPARTAALMSLASRKLTAANGQTCLVWINQMRESIGITFGNPEKTSGGRAMAYYASLRIRVIPAGKITEDKQIYTGEAWKSGKVLIAQSYKAVIEKSRLSVNQGKEVYFDWNLATGEVDMVKFIFAQCAEMLVLTNKGASWSFGSTKVVGRENFQRRMREDPDLMLEMTNVVKQAHGLVPARRPSPGRLKRLRKTDDV